MKLKNTAKPRLTDRVKKLASEHKQRHQPTGFGFVVADRVAYLDGRRWDRVTREASVFLRREVLAVNERVGPENIAPRYVMIFRGDQAVAAIAAQVVVVTGDRLHGGKADGKPGLLKRALGPAARKIGDKFRERILIAGNLLSWGFDGIAFAPGEDPEEIWPAVAEALYRIRRAEKLNGQTNFVMVKDIAEEHGHVSALKSFSYRPSKTEPNMVLKIDPSWQSFDDYLGAMESKYRRNTKNQAKKLAKAGCTIERISGLEKHADRLFELYSDVHANAKVRLFTLTPSYLPELERALGDDFRCSVVRRNDELLGFVTSVRNGNDCIGYFIGYDREAAAQGIPIYLNLLQQTVADAIDWGCQRLSWGRTALEPKAALGAQPEPFSVWIRHRVPAVNWLIKGMLDAVPHAEPPERHPFKKHK